MAVDCAQLAAWLTEARNALHQVITGGKLIGIRHGEKQNTYGQANIKELRDYVNDLQRQVDACNGVVSTNVRRIIGTIPK